MGPGPPRARGRSLPPDEAREEGIPLFRLRKFSTTAGELRAAANFRRSNLRNAGPPLRPGVPGTEPSSCVACHASLLVLLFSKAAPPARQRTGFAAPITAPTRRRRGRQHRPRARRRPGAVAYLRKDGGVTHAFISRVVASAWRGARALDPTAEWVTEVRSRPATATGSPWPGSPTATCTRPSPRAARRSPARSPRTHARRPERAIDRHRPGHQRRGVRDLAAGRGRPRRRCRTAPGHRPGRSTRPRPRGGDGHAAAAGRRRRGLRRRDLGRRGPQKHARDGRPVTGSRLVGWPQLLNVERRRRAMSPVDIGIEEDELVRVDRVGAGLAHRQAARLVGSLFEAPGESTTAVVLHRAGQRVSAGLAMAQLQALGGRRARSPRGPFPARGPDRSARARSPTKPEVSSSDRGELAVAGRDGQGLTARGRYKATSTSTAFGRPSRSPTPVSAPWSTPA